MLDFYSKNSSKILPKDDNKEDEIAG